MNPHLHPHPYVGFTGLPNQFKHNHDGFLGPSINQASAEDYTIAFFLELQLGIEETQAFLH